MNRNIAWGIGAVALLLGAITVGIVVFSLPIVESAPDGTCIRVLAVEDNREVEKPCGWEKGRKYIFRYVPGKPVPYNRPLH